jgi:hypothetical protein
MVVSGTANLQRDDRLGVADVLLRDQRFPSGYEYEYVAGD